MDEINSNERHEKVSFWVGVSSFLICGKSFGGGKFGGDNKPRSGGKAFWKKLLGIGVFTRTSRVNHESGRPQPKISCQLHLISA